MVRYKTALLFVMVLAIGGLVDKDYHQAHSNQPFNHNRPATLQARTSHMLDLDGSHCTLTVVGPHSILTAEHCNPKDSTRVITIDNSTEPYHLLGAVHDGRDHVIYLLDGPAFTNIEPYVTRAPVVGERVYIYGFGKEVYPAVIKTGTVLDEYDPSEVNSHQGLFYVSIPVIPGDSGAAIFGADGALLGLVTYQVSESGILFTKLGSADFQLAFPLSVIHQAQKFNSVKHPVTPKEQADGRNKGN